MYDELLSSTLWVKKDKEKIKQKVRECRNRKQAIRKLYYDTDIRFIHAWWELEDWIKTHLPKKFWKNRLLDMIDELR